MSRCLAPAHPFFHILTLRNLLKGLTRGEIIKMWCALWVGVWLTVLYTEYIQRYTPSVIYIQDRFTNEKLEATLYGDQVILHLRQIMPRDSCEGGMVIRRLVRLWPDDKRPKGLDKNEPEEVVFFKEHEVPWSHKGLHDFYLHLHLYGPVSGSGWIFEFERYDNCSWLDSFFPNKPVSPPGIPVKVIEGEAPPPGP